MKPISIQRSALIAGVTVLLLIAAFCGVQVHDLSQQQKAIKRDYSIVNSVSYGLLSVSRWRDLLVDAVGHQIENFKLTPAERDSLEKDIEGLLNALIDKADSIMRQPQKGLGAKLRQLAFKVFVKPKNLHKETPAFAQKIMAEIMRPRNKHRLMYVAKQKLEDLGQKTYDSAHNEQVEKFDSVFQKYQVETADAFNRKTEGQLAAIRHRMYLFVVGMLGSLALLLLLWWLLRRQQGLYTTLYILSIVMAFVFLITGLTSVMIELDARIDSLDFYLMGENIVFKDQVLFFQSKSIVDVVILLLRNGKYDSIGVAVLILCFSIIFPMSKLICTGLYLIGERQWTKSRLVSYFAFHSGKWSMADVMVVAIFMAYIGFNGILTDQMNNLNVHTDAFSSIATNRTSLQPGYLVFVTFVLFGLILSQILQKVRPERKQQPAKQIHNDKQRRKKQ